MRLASLTLLALSLAACAGETPNRAVVVRDSAGIRIVENTDPLWQPGEEWRLSAEPLVDIGGGDTDDDQLFRVVGALRLDDGRIVVANRGSYELRFFDPDGRFLSASGGRGGGPGEFQRITWMARAGPDTLAVYDARARRLSLFNAAGTYLESQVTFMPVPAGNPDFTPVAGGRWTPRPQGRFAGGGYAASQRLFEFSAESAEGVSRPDVLLLRFDPNGFLNDTLGIFPSGELTATVTTQGTTTAVLWGSPHFGHTTVFALHGDRYYVATGDRYEVMVYSSSGTLESIVRRVQEPIPVTQRELNRLLEARLADAEDEEARRRVRRSFESREASSLIPLLDTIAVDDGGKLWVREYDWPPGRRPTWTVFDGDGRLLGSVTFPERFAPYHIGGGFVLGGWQDELDVEHVLLYELIKPGR